MSELSNNQKKEIVELFCVGDSEQAFQKIAVYRSGDVNVKYLDYFNPGTLSQAKILLNYDYTDLKMSDTDRKVVASCIAMSDLIGEVTKHTAENILRFIDGYFICPSLAEYIESRPKAALFKNLDDEDLREIPSIYFITKTFEAQNAVQLHELISLKTFNGVEIMKIVDDKCPECGSKLKKKYSWNQIHLIPKLPLHWGCRCSYMMWK